MGARRNGACRRVGLRRRRGLIVSINLEWVGLACFRLWEDGGPVIAMDPYNPAVVAEAVGIDVAVFDVRLQAETVIVSSLTDRAHAHYQLVDGDPKVINALDVAMGHTEASINGEPLIAVQAAEAPHHPEGPDDNAMYAFKAGDLWVMHMGDLGYGVGADELAPFAGHCDVLLALTGEHLTLRLEELDPMIDILEPKWIVPMHYRLPPLTAGMTSVDAFLELRSRDPVFHARHNTVRLPMPTQGMGEPTIVVLEPSGYESE